MDTLLDFLKKHSDVDTGFIKDFIAIQNGDKTHAPFNIDLDVVTKWLNAVKGNLKYTLIDSYMKNIDYIVLMPNQKHKKNGQDAKAHKLEDKIKKMQEVITELTTDNLELRKKYNGEI